MGPFQLRGFKVSKPLELRGIIDIMAAVTGRNIKQARVVMQHDAQLGRRANLCFKLAASHQDFISNKACTCNFLHKSMTFKVSQETSSEEEEL